MRDLVVCENSAEAGSLSASTSAGGWVDAGHATIGRRWQSNPLRGMIPTWNDVQAWVRVPGGWSADMSERRVE